jgi:hypothetical protein
MATKTTPEAPDGYHSPFGQELAPSDVRADEPSLARMVGMIGAFAILFGVAVIVMNRWAASQNEAPRLISSPWGYVFATLGIGGLLFHAVRDADVQLRRIYGLVGGALVLAGIGLSVGGLFIAWGGPAFLLGLMFLMTFVRNEDDIRWRRNAVVGLVAVGAVLAMVGLIGGSINVTFLVPYGFVLALLGLFYLWATISILGTGSEFGYRLGWAIGVLGGLGVLVAVGRSIAPFVMSGLPRYLVPSGLLLTFLGLFYITVAIGICSERQLVVLTRRELAAYFYSPIAYLVLFGMTVIGWIMYWVFAAGLITEARQFSPHPEPIVRDYIVALVPVMCVVFVVPVLTMRLLSEERRTGTIEVMLTAPVDEITVVLSKFLAALVFYLFLWIPWGLFLVALRVEGGQPFDYLPLLSFYVTLVCSGAAFVAMGLFFSSLTRNQIVSAVLSFMGMMFFLCFFLLQRMELGPNWSAFFKHLSFVDLWIQSLGGMLYVRDLVLWLSMAVFWLFLTVKVLESRKWK